MPFSDMPDAARLWVYAADRPLSDDEEKALTDRLEDFLSDWTSHGRPVEGAAEVRDGRFVLLAAHRPDAENGSTNADVSGCGIDASVHVLESFADETGVEWESGLRVFYRNADGAVRSAGRPAFAERAQRGEVDAATSVFDLSVDTVADLRAGRFERPAATSWHAEAFPLS
ncbi:MAG: hypothetical protein BRD38_00185 [Bacteroidetes bacterium QH_9_67_14]|nr:MAG: hypothetical protein BRD38_00185 [Bacteroidetes bacterium QH_9_67_14]